MLGRLFAAHTRLGRRAASFFEMVGDAAIDVSDSSLYAWRLSVLEFRLTASQPLNEN
jgi:hypothetical protein